MPASSAIKVDGLTALQKALKNCEKEVKSGIRAKLRDVGEPVRVEAERLASEEIRRIGPAWSQMKIGLTSSLLYVAPKQRSTSAASRKRKNLAALLGRALNDAVDAKRAESLGLMENALDDILQRNW